MVASQQEPIQMMWHEANTQLSKCKLLIPGTPRQFKVQHNPRDPRLKRDHIQRLTHYKGMLAGCL